MLMERGATSEETIGLYAEREIRKYRGSPNKLFKETTGKVKRAIGGGPPPVRSLRPYDHEVGSEGIVAQLITDLCRKHKKRFLNHPSPKQIRRQHVRRFIVVSDLIGSGDRAYNYLDSAWSVRSVRSWHSLGWLRFEVVAYAATDAGRARVESHSCGPSVYIARPCPTIKTAFPTDTSQLVRDLCVKYDPVNHDEVEALGYHGIGALIAFAHSVTNNAPRILHVKRRRWKPLFEGRVTSGLRLTPKSIGVETSNRLRDMRQPRLAKAPRLQGSSPQTQRMVLVLAALSRGPRLDRVVAQKTGLTTLEVRKLIAEAQTQHWLDQNRRITDLGNAQLQYFRSWKKRPIHSVQECPAPYYPKQLRMPR